MLLHVLMFLETHVQFLNVILIGMNSVIMDDAVIGAGAIIGAMTFVKAEMMIPARSLVVGNPAKIIKE